jgi:hypothetical protein
MAARGRNPACDATRGRARMPAPIIVELKRKIPFVVEIDGEIAHLPFEGLFQARTGAPISG